MISTSLLTSCQPARELELSKVDSLGQLLEESKTNLMIDVDLLEARAAEITNQREFIIQNYTDTFPYELGVQLDKYKSIRKTYDRAIDEKTTLDKEHSELSDQITDLKGYITSRDYVKDSFKVYLNTERNDVIALHQNADRLQRELYTIETEYQRVRDYIEEVIQFLENKED